MLYFLGSCGQNAECYVINHNPVCKCLVDFTGDPFVGCEYNFNDTVKPELTTTSKYRPLVYSDHNFGVPISIFIT